MIIFVLYGEGKESCHLGTGFFVHHRIVSANKRAERRMKIMLEGEFNAKEGRENNFQTHNWELETTPG